MVNYHDLDNTGQEVQQRLDQVPVTQADLAEEVLARQAAVGAVQNNVDAEELRAKAAEKLNADDIDAIEEKIPSGASSSNKMATASDISSLDAAIEAILLLIPSAATSLNKLADKAFVNSSIATATATFRGTKNLVSDLNLAVDATHEQIAVALSEAVSGADNNDYAFVQVPTSSGTPTEIRVTERYKFDGTAWSYEYDLNNSGFTSDQWAAINSTITSGLVDKLNALPSNADLTAALGVLTNGIAAINEKIPTAATSSNKLVDTAAMQSYITQILDGIDATFNVTSTDGHVTFKMTQTDGVITSVQILTSDIASAQALTTLSGQVSTNASDIAALQDLYNALQQSAPEIIQPTDTWPVANPSTTVIYRVIDRENTPPEYYSDYMWNGTAMVLMAMYNKAIDPRPKKGSQNLVTSGGVFDNMGALDVSELNATENPHTPAIYADLSAALAAITSDYQKGGMSIKFVQGSVQSNDNKYVQARCMSQNFTTDVTQWQEVDDKPTAGSENLVTSGGVYESQAPMFEQSEEFDFPVTGKYLNDNAEEVSGANRLCTDYIPCKKGNEFVFNSSYNQTRFFVFDENKQNPVMLWKGVSTDQHFYICDSSYKYIRACSSTTDTSHYLRRLIKTTYDYTLEKISDVIKEDCVSFADANTGYILTNGTLSTNKGKYKEFQVYKGTVMELQAAGGGPSQHLIHNNQYFIAKKVGNSYIPLVLGSEVTLADIPYYYTFTEPMICCVSFYYADDTNKRAIRLKFTTNYAKSALEETQKHENDNASLNQELLIQGMKLGSLFDNIAVIGDSMSVGSLSSESALEVSNNFGASWLSFLARRWGCQSRFHYARGGSSTYTWLNDSETYGLGIMLMENEPVYNAYFIAYGHNDNMGAGSVSDEAAPVTVTDRVPSCPSGYTFTAYYKAIIDQIRTKAPHAMIFCMSEYDSLMCGTGKAAYRQAVIDVANLYRTNGDKLVFHLETGGVPNTDMGLGSHYSTIGYAHIAKRTDEEVNKVVYANMADEVIKTFGSFNKENVR